MEPKVHIVLASYNGEKFLRQQVETLAAQTYKNLSVEICDDGSSDGTVELAKKLCREYPFLSLHINEKNLGYVMNFLEGIKRSRADYIMLCDQDDLWMEDKVEITLKAMQEQEERTKNVPVLVYTDAMNFESETGKDLGSFHENSHLNTKNVYTAHLFMENKCIGCTVMINRFVKEYLEQTPEEIRVHDWWLALICAHFGKIVYVPMCTLRYRQHGNNMIGGQSFGSYIRSRLQGIARQKNVIRETVTQGQCFEKVFGDRMTEEQRKTAKAFAGLYETNGFVRRIRLCRYGFWKSGFVRNAGLMFLI